MTTCVIVFVYSSIVFVFSSVVFALVVVVEARSLFQFHMLLVV